MTMPRRAALAAIVTFALPLVSCTDFPGGSGPITSTVIVTEGAENAAKDDKGDKDSAEPQKDSKKDSKKGSANFSALAEAYKKAIADPSSIKMNSSSGSTPTGTARYGFADVTGDGAPEMLYSVGTDRWEPVSIFYSEDGGKTVKNTNDVLIQGVANSGGGRASVAAATSGVGIWDMSWMSMQPTVSAKHYTLEGNKIKKSGKTLEYSKEGENPKEMRPIAWFDSKNNAGFDILAKGSIPTHSDDMGTTGVLNRNSSGGGAPAQSSESSNSFNGTVRLKTAADLMDGKPTPNGESLSEEFWILELASPQEITAKSAAHTTTKTVSEIYLGENYNWPQYQDKQVTLTAVPMTMQFPTDASLPLGMLRLGTSFEVSAG